MSTLRQAAQQALEALEGGADSWQLVGPAIDALKEALVEDAMQKFTDVNQEIEAALAEPVQEPPRDHFRDVTKKVQEPVAWIQPDHLQKARVAPFFCRVEPTQRCSDFVALYTAPLQRKPLVDPAEYDDFGAAERYNRGLK